MHGTLTFTALLISFLFFVSPLPFLFFPIHSELRNYDQHGQFVAVDLRRWCCWACILLWFAGLGNLVTEYSGSRRLGRTEARRLRTSVGVGRFRVSILESDVRDRRDEAETCFGFLSYRCWLLASTDFESMQMPPSSVIFFDSLARRPAYESLILCPIIRTFFLKFWDFR